MFRFFKYISYVLISRKAIQGARSFFGEGGMAAQVIDAVTFNLKAKFRSAVLAASGALLVGIGGLYIIFHSAYDYDQNGYLTLNAQKGVCLAFVLVGLFMVALSRKTSQPVKPLTTNRQPNSVVPSQRAAHLQGLFQMMNQEAAKFIEQTTRPETQRATPRPPTNERARV